MNTNTFEACSFLAPAIGAKQEQKQKKPPKTKKLTQFSLETDPKVARARFTST